MKIDHQAIIRHCFDGLVGNEPRALGLELRFLEHSAAPCLFHHGQSGKTYVLIPPETEPTRGAALVAHEIGHYLEQRDFPPPPRLKAMKGWLATKKLPPAVVWILRESVYLFYRSYLIESEVRAHTWAKDNLVGIGIDPAALKELDRWSNLSLRDKVRTSPAGQRYYRQLRLTLAQVHHAP